MGHFPFVSGFYRIKLPFLLFHLPFLSSPKRENGILGVLSPVSRYLLSAASDEGATFAGKDPECKIARLDTVNPFDVFLQSLSADKTGGAKRALESVAATFTEKATVFSQMSLEIGFGSKRSFAAFTAKPVLLQRSCHFSHG
jgi:hypothetical protein